MGYVMVMLAGIASVAGMVAVMTHVSTGLAAIAFAVLLSAFVSRKAVSALWLECVRAASRFTTP